MDIKQWIARVAAVLVALTGLHATCILVGCGQHDDSEQTTTGKTQGAGGARQVGSTNGGGAPVAMLAAHVAGKACAQDKDCDRGSCAKQLTVGGANFLAGSTALDAPGGYCTGSCSTSADCGEGGSCIITQQLPAALAGLGLPGAATAGAAGAMSAAAETAPGRCYAACSMSSECRDGYRCVGADGSTITTAAGATGSCQPTPATDKLPDSVVGTTCIADADCKAGRCMTTLAGNMFGMTATTFTGGYCTGRCVDDSTCGATGACNLGFGAVSGTCYRKCESDADCGRDGYRCRAAAGAGLFPTQTTSASKQCTPGAMPLPDGVVGQACSSDAECGSAATSCKSELAGQFGGAVTALPGGYCTGSCVDASDCGAGGVCSGALGGFVAGTCYKGCTSAAECRAGYSCGTPSSGFPGGMGFPGMTATQTVCSPTPAAAMDQDAGTP